MLNRRRAAAALTMLGILVVFGGQTTGAEKEAPEKNKQDLPGFPKGIAIGMSAAELIKLRPNVICDDGKKPGQVDFSKGTHYVDDKDGDMELRYVIHDGRCVYYYRRETHNILEPIPERFEKTIGEGVPLKGYEEKKIWSKKTFAAHREATLREYRESLGSVYRKWLLQLKGNSVAYLAPSFVWLSDSRNVALTMTSDYVGVYLTEVTIRVDVWEQSKGFKFDDLFDQKPKTELVEVLFGPVEKTPKKEEKKVENKEEAGKDKQPE